MIDVCQYIDDMNSLLKMLKQDSFKNKLDCIVAAKRSGWILGVFLSNKLTLPVFSVSEMDSIPPEFKRVLVVDDTICKGKTLKKIFNRLIVSRKTGIDACLYVEGDVIPQYYIKKTDGRVRMWYENNIEVYPAASTIDSGWHVLSGQ